MASKKKAQYEPPASQVDLEERLENGNKSFRELSTSDTYEPPKDSKPGRDFRVEGNDTDQYIGTSPEYATYANDTEAPLAADDDNPETQVFEEFAASPLPGTLKVEGNVEHEGALAAAEAAKEASEAAKADEPEEEEEEPEEEEEEPESGSETSQSTGQSS